MTMTRDWDQSEKPRRRLTGRAVFLMLVGFFGVIATVNAVMITLAVDTLPGTVTDSAYRASQRFNAELAAARERAAKGWTVQAHADRAASGDAALRLSFRDGEGRPVEGLEVQARLVRPLEPAADRSFTLSRTAGGELTGMAEAVAPGAFDLAIEARRDGSLVYRSRDRILLP
jgi:nitrogen fixation protein FixH